MHLMNVENVRKPLNQLCLQLVHVQHIRDGLEQDQSGLPDDVQAGQGQDEDADQGHAGVDVFDAGDGGQGRWRRCG